MKFLKEEEIQVRDIALVSLVLHIGIMIDRVFESDSKALLTSSNIDLDEEIEIKKLRQVIENFIGRDLPDAEIDYLGSIFTSKITVQTSEDDEINNDILTFIDEILADIYSYYQVDFCRDEALKRSLYFHFISLIQRAKERRFLNNLMIEEIKENFPLIYDISVHISYLILKKLDIVLHEDEIGYISLHLMIAAEKLG
ncbi:MAG: PRD domain-containing protein [Erysipelothrix sp.]|nr:PRD domain-containing protein [Erysipelothrix sp.]